MSILADKIRRARELRVEAGGFTFVVSRPTDMDMLELQGKRDPREFVRFVIGWDGVRELDIIPGGDPHPAPFDADACREWLSDRADLLGPIIDSTLAAYNAHKATAEESAKN